MAFFTSPGINISELDLTTVVPAASTTTGGIAGVFPWGPVLTPVKVSSESDLVRIFGKPVPGFNRSTFFTAADFLAYTSALYVVRVDTGVVAAPTNATPPALAGFTAKYAGELGNFLSVQALSATTYSSASNVDYSYLKGSKSLVRGAPDANHIHVVVIDSEGKFSGAAGKVLEVYENISLTEGDMDYDGSTNYWIDVINNKSSFIKVENGDSGQFTANAMKFDFVGGTNGSDEKTAFSDIQDAYDVFKNTEMINVSLIMKGATLTDLQDDATLTAYIANICEERNDAMAFASVPILSATATIPPEVETWVNNVQSGVGGTRAASFLVLDSGYKYRYDRYFDTYVYSPLNGDIAGLCARTDQNRDPWFSPAGYNRGGIKNVIKLAFNPDKNDRDDLYKLSVNPVITEAGKGTLLFGDKTSTQNPSAFDRINVRRLFIVIEKAIAKSANSMLFEMNDAHTRATFRNMVEPFLRDVQGRNGLYEFKVVCDETNNTAEVIDRNEFVADCYLKASRAINGIQLNFVNVRTGIQFTEIVGKW